MPNSSFVEGEPFELCQQREAILFNSITKKYDANGDSLVGRTAYPNICACAHGVQINLTSCLVRVKVGCTAAAAAQASGEHLHM